MKLAPVVLVFLALLLTCCHGVARPRDCSDIHHQDPSRPSGVYTLYPAGEWSAVQVYCDLQSEGGQWTVIQMRMDGSLNFYRPWDQYKIGFGDPAGEYWLGLDNMHYLTQNKNYELLVELEDFNGTKVSARYSSFSVGAECDGFILKVSGFTDGGAGDSLTYHDGQKFSTWDRDQDSRADNCAKIFLGGFWYKACHYANPNGVYHWGADATHFAIGVNWYHWKGHNYSLKTFSSKIRPVQ